MQNATESRPCAWLSLHVVRQVEALSFFPDGLRLLVLSADDMVSIWANLNGYGIVQQVLHDDPVGRAKFGTDGTRVLAVP